MRTITSFRRDRDGATVGAPLNGDAETENPRDLEWGFGRRDVTFKD
jgi:hypothetical protein